MCFNLLLPTKSPALVTCCINKNDVNFSSTFSPLLFLTQVSTNQLSAVFLSQRLSSLTLSTISAIESINTQSNPLLNTCSTTSLELNSKKSLKNKVVTHPNCLNLLVYLNICFLPISPEMNKHFLPDFSIDDNVSNKIDVLPTPGSPITIMLVEHGTPPS